MDKGQEMSTLPMYRPTYVSHRVC